MQTIIFYNIFELDEATINNFVVIAGKPSTRGVPFKIVNNGTEALETRFILSSKSNKEIDMFNPSYLKLKTACYFVKSDGNAGNSKVSASLSFPASDTAMFDLLKKAIRNVILIRLKIINFFVNNKDDPSIAFMKGKCSSLANLQKLHLVSLAEGLSDDYGLGLKTKVDKNTITAYFNFGTIPEKAGTKTAVYVAKLGLNNKTVLEKLSDQKEYEHITIGIPRNLNNKNAQMPNPKTGEMDPPEAYYELTGLFFKFSYAWGITATADFSAQTDTITIGQKLERSTISIDEVSKAMGFKLEDTSEIDAITKAFGDPTA